MIVSEASAMQLSGNHYFKLEDCNHSEVCKPTSKKHLSYSKLVSLLKLCGAGEDEVRCLRASDTSTNISERNARAAEARMMASSSRTSNV